MHILLHFTQFMVGRQNRYREIEAPNVDEEDDNTYLCHFSGKKEKSECSIFLCVQIVCGSIVVILMSPSSHMFISMCHMTV